MGSGDAAVADWSRASSLTVYGGKLYASTATCYRTRLDPPRADFFVFHATVYGAFLAVPIRTPST